MVQNVKQRPEWYNARYNGSDVFVAFWGGFLFVAVTIEDAKADRFTVIPSHLAPSFEVTNRVTIS